MLQKGVTLAAKAIQTRQAILSAAQTWASEVGLDGLSIGGLAARAGISKSGLFAHFKSKEDLQFAILEFTRESFTTLVLEPVVSAHPPGMARLKAFYTTWWTRWFGQSFIPGGCVFGQAANEYSTLPVRVRDLLRVTLENLMAFLEREAHCAIQAGEIRKEADPKQVAFELYALLVGTSAFERVAPSLQGRMRADLALAALFNAIVVAT